MKTQQLVYNQGRESISHAFDTQKSTKNCLLNEDGLLRALKNMHGTKIKSKIKCVLPSGRNRTPLNSP